MDGNIIIPFVPCGYATGRNAGGLIGDMEGMMDKVTSLTREPALNPEPLFEQIDLGMQGLIRIAALITASNRSFFDHLSTPRTPDELAHLTGCREEIVAPVCMVLEEMGCVTRYEGRYSSTPLSLVFLARSSPYRQGAYLDKTWRHIRDLWMHLPDIIERGPVSYPAEVFFATLSLPAMAENALCGRLQRITREIFMFPGFRSFRRMIDLGGGHGLYAIACTVVNPDLHAWVFDMPHVLPLASRFIREYEATRVHTLAGNFFVDDFGRDYDLVFSSSNPSGKRVDMVPRIAKSLNPGGIFVNVQSTGREDMDLYQSLELELWKIEGEEKRKTGNTRVEPFMTDEYRVALMDAGLSILVEKDIKDDYHRDAFVRMIIAQKRI